MSNPNINPGAVETQQMRVVAPVGVRIPPKIKTLGSIGPDFLLVFLSPCMQSAVRLRLRITFSVGGQNITEQVDFSGFPPTLTGTPS
jgi:AP-1 complex subunit gamma-1